LVNIKFEGLLIAMSELNAIFLARKSINQPSIDIDVQTSQ